MLTTLKQILQILGLSEKITEILNIYESTPNFKVKSTFKKWCNYCRRCGHSISACRQKQKDNQNKPQKHKEPSKSFSQYMKKDQNLPNKNIYSNNSSGSRSNSRNNYPRSFSNTTQFVPNTVPNQTQVIDIIPMTDHETHTTEIKTIQTIEIEVTQILEIKIIQTIVHEIIHTIDQTTSDQMITINYSRNRNSSNNNRYRNYSQSPHRNKNRYPDSQHRYRGNTKKHQRQRNQVQLNEETTSDPPGIGNTESNELQLNHINCESTDTESDTDNTITVNMITVESDYEPIIYEQPFSSHINENQMELLDNYYIEPTNNNSRVNQEVNKINTVTKPDNKDETQCQIQIIFIKTSKKNKQEKKLGQFHFS